MFSQLGPLFKTTFRKAESNDTRQNIPHDERDKGRKKREELEKEEEKLDLWEENPSVTVDALRTFLIDFLKTLPGAEDSALVQSTQTPSSTSSRPLEKTRPTSTRNAKAVRAYQAMAAKSQNQQTPKEPPEETRKEPTADLLESQELRDIHKLIEDLDKLKNRGVTTLHIHKADSFVDSLTNAVRLEISKI